MSSQNPQTTYLKAYTPPDFLIEKVHLHFDIQDDQTIVKSILNIVRNPKTKHAGAPLILDGEELKLQAIYIDGKALTENQFEKTDTHLTIKNVSDQFALETHVVIFPKKNTSLMGLYQSRNNICTQCEAEGFRRITYFLDRPDVMSYFTTTISADKKKYPFLLSNGNLVEEKNLEHDRHWVHWKDPSKKPCYLFALVVGDFDLITDKFVTMKKRSVDLDLYLEKGFLDQGAHAMIALKKAMKWDEEKYGREYDLDRYMIVAVSDFNMGAMENKGLNIFNTKYILAKPSTATDTDYINIERVIAHEYFHNWSGNRITCRDWFQLTLKEGLTVFRDQSFTEDTTSKGVARIDVVNTLRNHQFPEDAGPMAHPIRPDSYMKIDNFYTVTVYEKGAEVIRMVKTLLSPSVFRKGMDLYFSRFDGQAVTTDDFIAVMQEASGKDLSQFLRWYNQAGTPVLRVKTHYDANKKIFDVIIKQSCPPTPGQENKLPMHMPFAIGLVGADCVDLDLQLQGENEITKGTKILELKKPEETFTFINMKEDPTPSLLRHFSAPVELQYNYTNEQLALLLQCDSDAFCRWEAGQRLFVNMIEIVAKDIAAKKTPTVNLLLLDSFEKLLSKPMQDKNLLARLLVFPSLKYLLTRIQKIDLDIIYQAKVFLENALAKKLETLWFSVLKENQLSGHYKFDINDAGHRRLKNICLYYLMKTSEKQYVDIAYHEAIKANNMTDQLGGLVALNDHDVPQREEALAAFYHQYQHEPLVVNKWLTLQASSTLPNTIEAVKNLIHNNAFDIKNPNNVFALLVTFGENTLRFNEINGAGYQLLADQVLVIDKNNPQVAARIVQPLTHWKKLDVVRGALMKAELTRLLESKKLSGNVFEIVSKSLL
ncbi:MAG TPA: aminopeptidase N [Coxiellaceae bacterium]|nr:MAG: aminopeptidase N [Gammaproteobacteria bacterium RIFCSPHIGHO2_12_FULL_36_30]HLB56378.1 aminopeptidase N [Coxiellaceae bacterium]